MNRRKLENRRGAALIAVVVCLGVALAILTTMASCMMLVHQQIRRESIANQSHFLCKAAADRALQKLKNNEDFESDVWRIPASELGGRGAAEVTVRLSSNAEESKTLEIVAKFPLESSLETETTRTVQIKE